MANRRLPMRKIKEVLRLKYDCNLSEREISRSCQVSRSTVADYLMKARAAGLGWPEAAALTDTQIEECLFPVKRIPSSVKRPEPDYEYIYNQLRTYRKFNLTLSQLWLEYKEKEVERLVIKLRKDGLQPASIGRVLRDQYGVPSVKDAAGKTVTKILEENGLLSQIPEDLLRMLKNAVSLNDHMKKNKKDYTSKHGLELLESKIRRLIKYYKKAKKLPKDFAYEPERAKLLVETAK